MTPERVLHVFSANEERTVCGLDTGLYRSFASDAHGRILPRDRAALVLVGHSFGAYAGPRCQACASGKP